MKTQKEYMNIIKSVFVSRIELFKDEINAYSYRDDRARKHINSFKNRIQEYGLKFSNCYHANGIGNNNDYMIYLETKDEDGFIIQKNVANFYYCYGVYGGCYVRLKDLATNETFNVGRAI
jgi:hypothetical protein